MVRLSEHHAMDCSEFLLRSVVCGASVAATREGREGPRGACVIGDTAYRLYPVCCLFAILKVKFWGFQRNQR